MPESLSMNIIDAEDTNCAVSVLADTKQAQKLPGPYLASADREDHRSQ